MNNFMKSVLMFWFAGFFLILLGFGTGINNGWVILAAAVLEVMTMIGLMRLAREP